MPPRAIVQVSLERDGALPEDAVTNTFHFEGDATSDFAALVVGLENRVRTFYQAIGGRLAGTLSGAFTIKVYNWADAKPRVPVSANTYTLQPGDLSMPGEVAMCVSMSAATVSGGNAARRRGRVFLGPFGPGNGIVQGGDVRISESAAGAVISAFLTMATGNGGAFRLAVFSPTTLAAGGSADEAWNDVVKVWIDNAWDTVRSRGAKATTRFPGTI